MYKEAALLWCRVELVQSITMLFSTNLLAFLNLLAEPKILMWLSILLKIVISFESECNNALL